VINKADGDNIEKAERAMSEYKNALHLYPPSPSGWTPAVKMCSARTKVGIPEVWTTVKKYVGLTKSNGFFRQKRQEQELRIMFRSIHEQLKDNFYTNPHIASQLEIARQKVRTGKSSAYQEAAALLDLYFRNRGE